MKPKHKSVRIKIICDYDTTPWRPGTDWLGEWYGLERDETGRPDGGYYKVTRSTGSHESYDEYVVWLKPPDDCPRPRDCVDIARAYYRGDWQYVGVVVEQAAVLTDDNGLEYARRFTDALWGIEHGYAYRSRPADDWPDGKRAIFDVEDTESYLREVMGDLRGEVERQSGVAIPDDEWAAAVAAAIDAGAVYE